LQTSPSNPAPAESVRGKRLLVVLGSYRSKRHVYEHARAHGVRVVVIDGPGHWSREESGEGELFERHLGVDVAPFHTFVDRAVTAVRACGLTFDGIGTIEEFAGGFTSRIAENLRLPFHTISAADSARDKHRARELCAAAGIAGPRFARVESEADLEAAAREVGWPCVLKPVSGVGSVQAFRIRDLDDLRSRFRETLSEVQRERDRSASLDSDRGWFDLMWSGRPAFVLESWIEGRKYDVDVLLEDGRLVYGHATDDLELCGLRDIRRVAPSGLDDSAERALVDHAAACVRALGFRDGAFNVEVKRAPEGPRTVEVNGRLGGYSTVDIHEAVWGIDLVEQWLRSCFRVPMNPTSIAARTFAAESLLPSPRSGRLEKDGFVDGLSRNADVIAARQWMFAGDRAAGVETGAPDWLGAVVARGESRETAIANLDRILASIDLPVR